MTPTRSQEPIKPLTWEQTPELHPGNQIATLLEAMYEADALYDKILAAFDCPTSHGHLAGATHLFETVRAMIERQFQRLGFELCLLPYPIGYYLRDRRGRIVMLHEVLSNDQRFRVIAAKERASWQKKRRGTS